MTEIQGRSAGAFSAKVPQDRAAVELKFQAAMGRTAEYMANRETKLISLIRDKKKSLPLALTVSGKSVIVGKSPSGTTDLSGLLMLAFSGSPSQGACRP